MCVCACVCVCVRGSDLLSEILRIAIAVRGEENVAIPVSGPQSRKRVLGLCVCEAGAPEFNGGLSYHCFFFFFVFFR